MKTVYTALFATCIVIHLTACGGSGGGSSDQKASNPSTPAITQPGGTSPVVPNDPPLTYYTLVKNATVSQAGHSYQITMTGHCVVYNSQDYCWDDGWQSIPAINYETDFWQLCSLAGVVGQCSGGGSTDPATTPRLWSSMAAKLVTPPFQPSDVYTQGIPTTVNCTITGTVVDCVDFSLDTSNASL